MSNSNRKILNSLASDQKFALMAIGFSGTLMVILHFLQPQLNLILIPVSEYTLTSSGWLMTIAFFSLSLGSWFLLRYFKTSSFLVGWKLGNVCLIIWIAGTALAGVFATDASGTPISWHGLIHGLSASLALGSLIVLEFAFFRRKLKSSVRWISGFLGTLALIALFANFATGYFGLFERIIIALHLIWLILICIAV